MRFIASFTTEADARLAGTDLVTDGFTVQGIRCSPSGRWIVRGGRSVATADELEVAEHQLAERVLDHDGEADSTCDADMFD